VRMYGENATPGLRYSALRVRSIRWGIWSDGDPHDDRHQRSNAYAHPNPQRGPSATPDQHTNAGAIPTAWDRRLHKSHGKCVDMAGAGHSHDTQDSSRRLQKYPRPKFQFQAQQPAATIASTRNNRRSSSGIHRASQTAGRCVDPQLDIWWRHQQQLAGGFGRRRVYHFVNLNAANVRSCRRFQAEKTCSTSHGPARAGTNPKTNPFSPPASRNTENQLPILG